MVFFFFLNFAHARKGDSSPRLQKCCAVHSSTTLQISKSWRLFRARWAPFAVSPVGRQVECLSPKTPPTWQRELWRPGRSSSLCPLLLAPTRVPEPSRSRHPHAEGYPFLVPMTSNRAGLAPSWVSHGGWGLCGRRKADAGERVLSGREPRLLWVLFAHPHAFHHCHDPRLSPPTFASPCHPESK